MNTYSRRSASKALKLLASELESYPHDSAALGLLAALVSKIIQKSKNTQSKLTPIFSSALTELLKGVEYLPNIEDNEEISPSEIYERHFDNSRDLNSLVSELVEEIQMIGK